MIEDKYLNLVNKCADSIKEVLKIELENLGLNIPTMGNIVMNAVGHVLQNTISLNPAMKGLSKSDADKYIDTVTNNINKMAKKEFLQHVKTLRDIKESQFH